MLLLLLIVIGLIVSENIIESRSKLARAKLTRKISLSFGCSSSVPPTSLSDKHHEEPKLLHLC